MTWIRQLFLDTIPRTQATKEKLDKQDFIKINFKGQYQEGEKLTQRKRENICKSRIL